MGLSEPECVRVVVSSSQARNASSKRSARRWHGQAGVVSGSTSAQRPAQPGSRGAVRRPSVHASRQSKVIEIAALSVAGLGFGEGATYEQLTARALESGLVECPLELGPHLRMQFLNQPEGSAGFPATQHRAPPGSITVASSPLDDSDETPKGFYLRRIDGVLWLQGLLVVARPHLESGRCLRVLSGRITEVEGVP